MKNKLHINWPSIIFVLVLIARSGALWGQEIQQRPPKKPDIILVILDTVRRDHTGIGTEDKSYTPNLDKLALDGTTFSNAWSTAPWTVPAHASFFTGLLPCEHGCTTSNLRLNKEIPTIAELLKNNGYETVAVFSNPWLCDQATALLRGFEKKYETEIGGISKMLIGRGDQGGLLSNQKLTKWLDARPKNKPLFLFVNYLEAHLPYDPPLTFRKQHLPQIPLDVLVSIKWAHEYNAGLHHQRKVNWNLIRRLYGGDVHTTDSLLGSLLDILRQRDLYNNSVIMVTSDHGENLGEHELIEHQFSVHETLLAVPLVIRAPIYLKPGKVALPVMLTDLYTTIAAIAGIKLKKKPVFSVPLPGLTNSRHTELTHPHNPVRPVIAEYSGPQEGLLKLFQLINPTLNVTRLSPSYRTVRVGDFRLTEASGGSKYLHKLSSDPNQENNIIEIEPQLTRKLQDILTLVVGNRHQDSDTTNQIDQEIKKKLEALGYIQ